MSGMVKFCRSTCNTYITPQKYKRKVYNPIFIIKKIIKIIKIIWMMKLLLNLTKPLMVEFNGIIIFKIFGTLVLEFPWRGKYINYFNILN